MIKWRMVTNRQKKYDTAFTSGSLFLKEAEAVVSAIQNPEDFMKGQELEALHKIPVNSEASRVRIGRELRKRIRNLKDPDFINVYLESDRQNKGLILFYAVCLTYPIILDFMVETVLKKWHNLDLDLSAEDFQSFLYKKMDDAPELMKLTPSTQDKLSQVVTRMLNELGLVKNGKLQKLNFDQETLKKIVANGDGWYLEVLLLNEQEQKKIMRA